MELTVNAQRHTVGGCEACTRDCKNNDSRKETDMHLVDRIISNTHCTEADRPWLVELHPHQLELLMPAAELTLNCEACSCQPTPIRVNVAPLALPQHADYLTDREPVTVNRPTPGRVAPLALPSQADYCTARRDAR